MKTKVLKVRGDKFCQLEVELRGEDPEVGPELSVCGTSGTIVTADEAVEQALEYWFSFFEDNNEAIGSMVYRFPNEMADYIKEYGDAAPAAAHFVVDTDGVYHGLDVFLEDDCKIYLTECGGQIRDELRAWFPEHAKHFKHHLNHMHAGCEHQEVLGWGRGHDVHLARGSCTQVQLLMLDSILLSAAERKRKLYVEKSLLSMGEEQGRVTKSGTPCKSLYNALQGMKFISLFDLQCMTDIKGPWTIKSLMSDKVTRSDGQAKKVRGAVLTFLQQAAVLEYPDEHFTVQSFKDSIGAPCPECGNLYGTSWLKRKLPEATLTWAENLKSATIMEDCDEEDEEDEG